MWNSQGLRSHQRSSRTMVSRHAVICVSNRAAASHAAPRELSDTGRHVGKSSESSRERYLQRSHSRKSIDRGCWQVLLWGWTFPRVPTVPRDFNDSPCASPSGSGWRAQLQPSNHPVSDFHFDVVIGADGRRSTLDGETETPNSLLQI